MLGVDAQFRVHQCTAEFHVNGLIRRAAVLQIDVLLVPYHSPIRRFAPGRIVVDVSRAPELDVALTGRSAHVYGRVAGPDVVLVDLPSRHVELRGAVLSHVDYARLLRSFEGVPCHLSTLEIDLPAAPASNYRCRIS